MPFVKMRIDIVTQIVSRSHGQGVVVGKRLVVASQERFHMVGYTKRVVCFVDDIDPILHIARLRLRGIFHRHQLYAEGVVVNT